MTGQVGGSRFRPSPVAQFSTGVNGPALQAQSEDITALRDTAAARGWQSVAARHGGSSIASTATSGASITRPERELSIDMRSRAGLWSGGSPSSPPSSCAAARIVQELSAPSPSRHGRTPETRIPGPSSGPQRRRGSSPPWLGSWSRSLLSALLTRDSRPFPTSRVSLTRASETSRTGHVSAGIVSSPLRRSFSTFAQLLGESC